VSDIDSHAHAGTAKPFFIYLPYTMTHQSRLLAIAPVGARGWQDRQRRRGRPDPHDRLIEFARRSREVHADEGEVEVDAIPA
jgi:hypothetical protein